MEGPDADPALRLWRALARRCVGPYSEHAAAPLTLAGWVAWSTGDEPGARVALGRALRVDPEYVFARLLHQACNEGLDPEALRSCLRKAARLTGVLRGPREQAGARTGRASQVCALSGSGRRAGREGPPARRDAPRKSPAGGTAAGGAGAAGSAAPGAGDDARDLGARAAVHRRGVVVRPVPSYSQRLSGAHGRHSRPPMALTAPRPPHLPQPGQSSGSGPAPPGAGRPGDLPPVHNMLICVALPRLAISPEHGQLTGTGSKASTSPAGGCSPAASCGSPGANRLRCRAGQRRLVPVRLLGRPPRHRTRLTGSGARRRQGRNHAATDAERTAGPGGDRPRYRPRVLGAVADRGDPLPVLDNADRAAGPAARSPRHGFRLGAAQPGGQGAGTQPVRPPRRGRAGVRDGRRRRGAGPAPATRRRRRPCCAASWTRRRPSGTGCRRCTRASSARRAASRCRTRPPAARRPWPRRPGSTLLTPSPGSVPTPPRARSRSSRALRSPRRRQLSGLRVAGEPFAVRISRLGLGMVEEAADGLQLGV